MAISWGIRLRSCLLAWKCFWASSACWLMSLLTSKLTLESEQFVQPKPVFSTQQADWFSTWSLPRGDHHRPSAPRSFWNIYLADIWLCLCCGRLCIFIRTSFRDRVWPCGDSGRHSASVATNPAKSDHAVSLQCGFDYSGVSCSKRKSSSIGQ